MLRNHNVYTVDPQHSRYVRSDGTNCQNTARDITDRLLICKLNIYPMFTQILRCSHAVLDCASLKAEVWSCLGQASGIAEPHPYHYSYGVEPHKRKQPCTESADPQHTCTLGFIFLAVLKFANVEGRV
ncbi:hypothetical protein T10_13055 [Trichinella papuae]|uniref:Uncharacterized protein n=1 Tax=Trichinella papuae TaxID=268474 RepID=A0A0V1MH21_9BILA|nr:hypothetical protein T10_13055 [Trichinella papuae]